MAYAQLSNKSPEWYYDDKITTFIHQLLANPGDIIINTQCRSTDDILKVANAFVSTPIAGKIHLFLPICIHSVMKDFSQQNHWAAIHIKHVYGKNFIARYFDPMGHKASKSVEDLFKSETCLFEQPLLTKPLQSAVLKGKEEFRYYKGNTDDCGPFICYILANSYRDVTHCPVMNKELKSRELGKILREGHNRKMGLDTLQEQVAAFAGDETLPDLEIESLAAQTASTSLATNKPSFVISTIAYVPRREYEQDSSDEEPDVNFKELIKGDTYPYYAEKQTHKRKIEFKDIAIISRAPMQSLVVEPFLAKLESNAFETVDKAEIRESIATSIALNRMQSISTRNNNSLKDEIASKAQKHKFPSEKFGFFWECQWYNLKDKKVPYSEVQKFYKMLKKYNSGWAEDFLKKCESGIPVPYQELREYAKDHPKTKHLVTQFRQRDTDNAIYLSLIDSDTVDFNGIYSAYFRITKNSLPTVMSTGYEFSSDNKPLQLASQIDRQIRVITNKYIPGGVYYPEPNTCILIPQDSDTVPESFIDKSIKDQTSESVAILRQVIGRKDVILVFSNENPIITTVPPRALLTKAHKTLITFSEPFTHGASPTKKDIKSLKQVSQSHFHESVWYTNLFINKAIKISDSNMYHCKSLLAQIRNGDDAERQKAIKELKQYIDSQIVDNIVIASNAIKQHIAVFEIEYIRQENESKLFQVLKKQKVKLQPLPREAILILSQETIVELIEQHLVDVRTIILLSTQLVNDQDSFMRIIETIFYSDEILELLKDEKVAFSDIPGLASSTTIDTKSLSMLEHFISAIEKEEYSALEIINAYNDDPLHLTFMAGDPTDIVLENAEDEYIVKFGIKYYSDNVDIAWIRGELGEDSEGLDSAALMEFERIIGCNASVEDSPTSTLGDSEYASDEEC